MLPERPFTPASVSSTTSAEVSAPALRRQRRPPDLARTHTRRRPLNVQELQDALDRDARLRRCATVATNSNPTTGARASRNGEDLAPPPTCRTRGGESRCGAGGRPPNHPGLTLLPLCPPSRLDLDAPRGQPARGFLWGANLVARDRPRPERPFAREVSRCLDRNPAQGRQPSNGHRH